MDAISLQAKAKINLSLDITGKRNDGYHEVIMIMQTIALHDDILIENADSGIHIDTKSALVPKDAGNIAYKAAELFFGRYGIKRGIKIKLDKKIPVSAGLAGGSSDAASVLKGLDRMLSMDLDQDELMRMGKDLGADVPYCIKGGTMLAEGIGEILTALDPLPHIDIVLICPRICVSTEWAYKALDLRDIRERPDTCLLMKAIKDKDIELLAVNMKNVLETVTVKRYGVVNEIKTRLIELGAAGSIMSGSGPSVFGIFTSQAKAKNAYESIKNNGCECFLTNTE
jgi:4-diphosphocytidyl-2-C-methyl-D-erythritol kinase